jgi:hypothetical protein
MKGRQPTEPSRGGPIEADGNGPDFAPSVVGELVREPLPRDRGSKACPAPDLSSSQAITAPPHSLEASRLADRFPREAVLDRRTRYRLAKQHLDPLMDIAHPKLAG